MSYYWLAFMSVQIILDALLIYRFLQMMDDQNHTDEAIEKIVSVLEKQGNVIENIVSYKPNSDVEEGDELWR